jgi:hypothetical protein
MSTVRVFLDIEKALDTTRQLPNLHCQNYNFRQVSLSFFLLFSLTENYCRSGIFYPQRKSDWGASNSLIFVHINDYTAIPGNRLASFADDTYLQATEKLKQRAATAV